MFWEYLCILKTFLYRLSSLQYKSKIFFLFLIKYFSFLIGVIWSYSIIKTQSVFSKKAGLIFNILITKVSWFTLIAACYFGYKNFSIKFTIIGIIIAILLVNIGFYFSKKFINERFSEKQITIFKSFFEYTLIFWVLYYVLF